MVGNGHTFRAWKGDGIIRKADTSNAGYRPFFYEMEEQLKGFFKVQTPEQLYKKIERFKPLSSEKVSIEDSLHRVLSEDIISSTNLPEFPRSTVDGFALRAKDTYGATEKNPAIFRLVGEIPMGQVSDIEVKGEEAVKVATGGMVPKGADAVEMVEYTEWVDSHTLHVFRTVSPLENVIQVGEDVKAGNVVLRKGLRVRPQHIGLMAGIGKTDVHVYLRPRVGIISSGDEIVPIETTPQPGEVRDMNRYTIVSMVEEAGGIPFFLGIVKDRFNDLKEKIASGLRESDMVIITGGSSVGTLDLTRDVLRSFPGAEIMAHGVSVKPGKPTLLAAVDGKPFLGLPGHPVSAMVIFQLFGKSILRILSGQSAENIQYGKKLKAKASRNIPSVPGREDYVRVKLEERDGALWAHPIFGKSGAISNLANADGLLRIAINDEGLEEGEEAEVILI
jgi:molybdopterin molybdotransferase